MQINEVEFNPNYIQTIVDEIDEFLREFGFRSNDRNIRGGRYDNFYQIFFDWNSTKIISGNEENEITLKLKKLQRKLLKDMNILMVFHINPLALTINFKNWFFKRIKPPKYIYHSTDSLEKVKSILKFGLIPKSSEESERWKTMSLAFPELIFFETEPNRNRWGMYVFKIDTDELKDYKFYTDINLDARNQGFIGDLKLMALVTNKSIPPDKIELLDKNHVMQFIGENKLNLKSRAKQSEEDAINYWSDIIRNTDFSEKQPFLDIPQKHFELLDDELKYKFLKDKLYVYNIILLDNNESWLGWFHDEEETEELLSLEIGDKIQKGDEMIYCIPFTKKDNNSDWGMGEGSIRTKSYIITNNVLYTQPEKWEVEWFKNYILQKNSINESEKQWKLIYSPTKEIIIKGLYSLCKWKLNELKKSVPTNKIGNYKIVPI
jgi:hypothetical protein